MLNPNDGTAIATNLIAIVRSKENYTYEEKYEAASKITDTFTRMRKLEIFLADQFNRLEKPSRHLNEEDRIARLDVLNLLKQQLEMN